MALKACDFCLFAKLKNREYNKNMDQTNSPKPSIHKLLAHSYVVFLGVFLLGVCLDILFKIKVFNGSSVGPLGYVFLVIGTALVLWAQKSTRSIKKETITRETFSHGPYKYTRNPTHWGLFLLTLGFGMVINAFFVIIFSFITFLLTKAIFISKEEKLLADKYGAPYLEYKNSVRL